MKSAQSFWLTLYFLSISGVNSQGIWSIKCIFSRLEFWQHSIPRVKFAVRKFTPKILHIKVWAGDPVWATVKQTPGSSRVQSKLSKPPLFYSSSVNPAHRRDEPVTSRLGGQDMFGVNFLTENIPLNVDWWIWELIIHCIFKATQLTVWPKSLMNERVTVKPFL